MSETNEETNNKKSNHTFDKHADICDNKHFIHDAVLQRFLRRA